MNNIQCCLKLNHIRLSTLVELQLQNDYTYTSKKNIQEHSYDINYNFQSVKIVYSTLYGYSLIPFYNTLSMWTLRWLNKRLHLRIKLVHSIGNIMGQTHFFKWNSIFCHLCFKCFDDIFMCLLSTIWWHYFNLINYICSQRDTSIYKECRKKVIVKHPSQVITLVTFPRSYRRDLIRLFFDSITPPIPELRSNLTPASPSCASYDIN